MQDKEPFRLDSRLVGPLPIVNHFFARMGVDRLLECHMDQDRRRRISLAQMAGVVCRNVCVGREPVYGLKGWAASYEPGLVGLTDDQAEALNDDRAGRALLALFDTDRASLLTELMLGVIAEFQVDLGELHNDSTSISFTGAYASAKGGARGGKPTPKITYGHSKDHRPDLKQLVWILTVSADGAVPVAYRTAAGNTNDDKTHIETWDGLGSLCGRKDFLYVADSKLCNRDAMAHIAARGGRFVSVMPRSRKEDGWFRDFAQNHDPAWDEAARRPGALKGDSDAVWSTFPAPAPSAEGHRIVWVKSTDKQARDQTARQDRIEAAAAELDELAERLALPRSRLRTRVAVEQAADAALAKSGATRWVNFTVTETQEERYRQERRGRPGVKTRYRKITRTRLGLTFEVDSQAVAYDARTDGCFPLISNDTQLTDAELLAAYRYQPNLEKRHAQLKGTQLVAPVFLKDPPRIEGLLFCYYIALLTHALIERHIRWAMTRHSIDQLPLYHEQRSCKAPTTARIFDAFAGISRHHLIHDDHTVQVFEPELTGLQKQLLDLLGVPHDAYTSSGGGR